MARKPRPKPAAAGARLVRLRKDAAAALGIADRQLGNWVDEPWFPADGKTPAGWNVAAIRKARDIQGRKGSSDSDAAKKLKLATDAEGLKQSQIKTQVEGLKLREREGELLPRPAWELFAATLLTQLGDWCDQLPAIVSTEAPRKYRKPLEERLRRELDLKRRELRDELERAARDLQAAKDAQR